jgi:Na+-transporting NADH:ubiquinone oxidoreductase subunit A
MANIKITKGLDIPIKGMPKGTIQVLQTPSHIALNLDPFEDVQFKLLAKKGDRVKIGQPLVEDKNFPGRVFVSPAGGTILEIRRGLKRRLLDIVITVEEESYYQTPADSFHIDKASYEEIVNHLKIGGMFTHIRRRPFNLLANPEILPKSIFVKAIESAPFVPPAELQVEGYEEEFALGLKALSKITKGAVHLVHRKDSLSKAFTEAPYVQRHTAEGPHPIGNQSVHIQQLDPIYSPEDNIWTLNAHDVVVIGYFLRKGQYFVNRIIGIGGPGIIPERTGFYKVRTGCPISFLISNRIEKGLIRFVSGDLLNGKKVDAGDFLRFYDYVFSAVSENTERKFLHFLRLGFNQFSFSKAYASGHRNNENREYEFTTSLHGEERAFVDGSLYDKVMPLNVPVMNLVKAVMAEDYELAHKLGLLEVDEEDFALPAFVCPSKIEMVDIIKRGLKAYASQIFG